MTLLSHYLTTEHNQCDDLYAEAESAVAATDWAIAEACFKAFEAATLGHFAREESVLFPAFETATGMQHGPTEVMRAEHAEIVEGLAGLREAIARRDGHGYLGLAETVLMLMRQHNLKEEGILYLMADRALANDVSELVSKMESIAP